MKTNRYSYYLLLLLIGLCESSQSNAQATCSGTALAPVFKQTFGTSASSTTKTTVPGGFITNYTFNGSTALADGQYMVTPLVQNSQKNDWAVGGDHTGDLHGNMFLVNAGTGASLFFKQQVDNLCPGSTYSFSAWIVNVNTTTLTLPICGASIVYPNVTFNIKNTSGTILQSFNTGNIPLTASTAVAPNWQQYGFQFTLPAGTTSLVLEMVDYYGGLPQCGNDLAIDDIMFSACTPQATIALNTSTSICAGSNTTMSSSLLNSPFITPAYQWQKSTDGGTTWNNVGVPGTSATSFPLTNVTTADGGKYRVIVGPDVSSLSSNTCVTASNTITLAVNALPTVSITSNSPVCIGTNTNLTASVSGGLAPYTYSWSGPSSFVSSISNPVITGTTAGNAGAYALTVTDANSCTTSTSTSVTVPAAAPAAVAGTDQSICIGNSVTLSANTPSVGSGSWSQVGGPGGAVITVPLQTNPTVSSLTAGTYTFRWTITVWPTCPSTTDDIDIVVAPATVAGTLSGATTVCTGSNTGSLLLSGYTGSIVQWESSNDGGTTWSVITNTTSSLSYNNLTATTTYRVLVKSGSCAALYSNNVIVGVNPNTNAGSLSGAAVVCSGSNSGNATLSGYTGNIVQWESSTNGGSSWSVINNTTNTYSYNNLTATTMLRVLVQSSPCASQYSNVITLTVTPVTVPGTISGSATVCASSNAGNITLTGNTGNIVQWESSVNGGVTWVVIGNTTNSLSYSNLSATTIYRVLVQNGICASQYTNQVTIGVNQATVAGTLSGAAAVCASSNNGNIVLGGNVGNVVQWESSIDGGATWVVIANTTNTLSYNNFTATTSYRVLVQNGVCAAQYSNQVTVTVNQPTVAGTLTGAATVCSSSNSGNITLSGNTGNIIHWESSTDGGTTWATIANTTNSLSYNNLSATTLYRVLVQNGVCAAQYSNQVTITVNQATIAGTLSGAAAVCASLNNGTISLSGNNGNIIQWESSVDGGTTWSVIANTTNSFSYTNLTATTVYRVLVQNGVCAAQYSNTVTINVSQPTIAGTITGNATVCAATGTGNIILSGNTGNIIHWESSTDGGTTWATIANTTNSLSYNNLSATTLYRVLVQNGVCAAQYSNQVTITVNQATVAGTLSAAATVCASSNNGTVSLAGILGNVVQWESSTDGGATWSLIANTSTSLSYNNLAATTTFRALVQNGVCAAQYSNQVTITVNQATVAGTLSGASTVCASSNNGTVSLAGILGNVVQWESSTDGGATWSVIANTSTSLSYNNLAATTTYRALVQNGVCAAQYSNQVIVTVNPPTVAGTLAGAATVCSSSNSGNITLSGNTGNIIQWESSVDGGTSWSVITNTSNSLSYNNLSATTLYRVLVQNGVCAAQYSNQVTITVNQATVAGVLSGAATVCASSNNGTVSLAGILGNVVQWESSTDGGATWSVIANTSTSLSYNNLAATTTFRALVQNGVCVAQYSNQVAITVNQATAAGTLSSAATVCASSNNGTVSLAGILGNVVQWESSTDGGTTWSVISNTSTSLSYNNLTATTTYRALVQNGVCAAQYSSQVTVAVNQPTVAGTLAGAATVCSSSNSGNISLSGNTGNIIQWEVSVDGGTTWATIANTSNSLSYNNLSATTSYRVLVQNGVCAAQYSNQVTITVNAPTVAGIASGNAIVCASANSGDIQLTGNTGNVLHWESSADGGSTWTVLNNSSANLTYQDLAATTSYRAFVQNGVCAPAYSNTVTIQVDQATVPGAVSANAVACITANSGDLYLKNYTGSIQKWQSSADNGNSWSDLSNVTDHQSYSNITLTTLYRAVVQNGVCVSSYSTPANISVVQTVTKADAGADLAVCNATSVSLTASPASSGNGSWRMLSGPSPVTFTNAGSPVTSANGTIAGVYRFEWRISNNVCADSKDTIDVIVHPSLTNLTDTLAKTVCANQTVIISGSAATGGNNSYQYQWEESSNGITWNPIANASGQSYSFTANSTVYLRRNVQSLPCQSASAVTLVKVQQSVANNRISGDQVICMNAPVKQIDGSMPTGGDGNYLFRWQQSVDTGITWSDQNAVTGNNQHMTPSGSFTRSMWFRRIVTTNVCTGPLSNTSNTVAVIVNPLPAASVQYKGGVYCQLNTPVDFAVTTTNTDSIRWNFGDGTMVKSAAQNVKHVYTASGTFVPSIQLISKQGCATDISAADTIRVDELKAGFTITAEFDCGRSFYRFTDTTQSFFPIGKREWTINQVAVNGGKEVKQEYSSAGRYEAGLRLQNIYGCSDALKASYNVGIYSYPKADINAVGQACLNDPLQFQSVVNSPDSVKARIWNLGNGSTATDSVVKITYYKSGEYIVRLMVGTINNCYDSAMKQLSIHPLPKVNVKADNIVCKGDSLVLKADGASTYIWKENDQVVCTNCSTLKISPQRNTQYKVVGYSEFGCSQVAATNVRVIQPFRIDLAPADTMCIGQSKRIIVTGAGSYTWRADAGLSNYNTGITFASPAVTTTYRVTGRDNYNCFADTAEIKIVVGKPTEISVGRDTSILSGEPVRLHAVASVPEIRKWQWKGNATFSCINCAEPTAKVIQDECLSCTATNIYGCPSTDTVCITTFCPGSEVFIPNAFTPDGDGVNDLLFVQGRGIKLIKSFRVFSRWGELVFEKLNFSPGDRSAGWDGRVRGKLASPDVYVYVCEAICEKGTPAIFKGNTAILK